MDTVGVIELKSEGHLTLKSLTFNTFTSFRKRQEWHLIHWIAHLYMSKLGLWSQFVFSDKDKDNITRKLQTNNVALA